MERERLGEPGVCKIFPQATYDLRGREISLANGGVIESTTGTKMYIWLEREAGEGCRGIIRSRFA
jgi:hypothetical protein